MLTIKNSLVALVAIAASIPLANSQNVRGRVLQRPDRDGPPYPGPGHGPGGPPFPDFYNITCKDNGGAVDFSCDLPRGEDPGVFVCRTKTHRGENVTSPMCIPTDRALVDDECGCCDMDCPEPCDACPCDITGRDGKVREGVFVSIEDDEEETCVPKFASAKLVYHREDVTCFKGCRVD
jgi:hypothetical protein